MEETRRDNRKKIAILLLLAALIVIIAISFAWFATLAGKDIADIHGNTKYVKMYFADGAGTEEDPYIIAEPEHLSNLAWLQYLGYFNKGTTVYFKVAGKNASTNKYTDSITLDMTGWILPPIGTTTYPFVGNFDGNNSTISNAKVINSQDQSEYTHTYTKAGSEVTECHAPAAIKTYSSSDATSGVIGVNSIGLFGVVGKYGGVPSYSTSGNEVKDLLISDINIESSTSKALIGIAAGYVNATLEGVGVKNATVKDTKGASAVNTGYTSKLSDYTLVGYCTSEYLEDKTVKKTEVSMPEVKQDGDPTGGGGASWGSSIQMNDLNTRLVNMKTLATDFGYSTKQIIHIDKDGNRTTTEGTIDRVDTDIKHYNDGQASDQPAHKNGTVAFTQTGTSFHTLYGAKDFAITKTIETTEDIPVNMHLIIDSTGTYHLNYDASTGAITTGTVSANLASLNMSIEMYGDELSNGVLDKYQQDELNSATESTDDKVDAKNTDSTEKDEQKDNKTDDESKEDSKSTNDATDKTTDSATNEIVEENSPSDNQSSEDDLDVNEEDEAVLNIVTSDGNTPWYLTGGDGESNGYLATNIGTESSPELRYLNADSSSATGISVSASPITLWTKNSYGQLACQVNGVYKVLSYSDGAWRLGNGDSTYVYITDNQGNYLCINSSNNGVTNGTDPQTATKWAYQDNVTNKGTIFWTEVNGTRYYLYRNNGSLSVTTNNGLFTANGWSTSSDSIYSRTNDVDSYVHFEGGMWILSPYSTSKQGFYLCSGDNYLNVVNGSIATGTDEATATIWQAKSWTSGARGELYPSGDIWTIQNGTTYHLVAVYPSLVLLNNTSENWIPYETSSTRTRYTLSVRTANIFKTTYYSIKFSSNKFNLSTDASSSLNPSHAVVFDSASFSIETPKAYRPGAGYNYAGYLVSKSEGGTMGEKKTVNTGGGVYTTPDTIIPLSASTTNPFMPSSINTGYIVSGANSDTSGTKQDKGDIRVSSDYFHYINLGYSSGISFLNYVLGNDDYDSSKLQIVTKNAKTAYNSELTGNANKYVRIGDSENNNCSSTSGLLGQLANKYGDVMSVEELGLKRYDTAKSKFASMVVGDNNNLYGLHFMNSTVDKNDVTTIPVASLYGEDYTNYELPRDSIDFKLSETGYVNFFAGSFFADYSDGRTKNDSFFSLHKVYRNSNKIVNIKEIDKIYEESEGEESYLYRFADGSFEDSSGKTYASLAALQSGNSKLAAVVNAGKPIFDLDWIENPDLIETDVAVIQDAYQGALYYFEIPINSGEYALGAVEGKTGAYLIYLDIGTNPVSTVTTTDIIQTKTGTVTTPKGIDFVSSSSELSSIDDASAAMSIASTGSSMNKTVSHSTASGQDTITVSSATGVKTEYCESGSVVKDSGGAVIDISDFDDVTSTETKKIVTTDKTNDDTNVETFKQVIITDKTGADRTVKQVETITKNGTSTTTETTLDPTKYTEDIEFDDDNVVLAYCHNMPSTVSESDYDATFIPSMSGTTKKDDITGTYTITVTPNNKFDILVTELNTIFSGSKINGTGISSKFVVKHK